MLFKSMPEVVSVLIGGNVELFVVGFTDAEVVSKISELFEGVEVSDAKSATEKPKTRRKRRTKAEIAAEKEPEPEPEPETEAAWPS